MQPLAGVKQREKDAKPVEEPTTAEKRRHEIQLTDYVENVQTFDEQKEEEEIIAVFPSDANLIAAISQAVELLAVGRQRQIRVQLLRQVAQHLVFILRDFLQVAQLFGGSEDGFDVDARIDGERVPNQERHVEEEALHAQNDRGPLVVRHGHFLPANAVGITPVPTEKHRVGALILLR